jgi:hypothetical protein
VFLLSEAGPALVGAAGVLVPTWAGTRLAWAEGARWLQYRNAPSIPDCTSGLAANQKKGSPALSRKLGNIASRDSLKAFSSLAHDADLPIVFNRASGHCASLAQYFIECENDSHVSEVLSAARALLSYSYFGDDACYFTSLCRFAKLAEDNQDAIKKADKEVCGLYSAIISAAKLDAGRALLGCAQSWHGLLWWFGVSCTPYDRWSKWMTNVSQESVAQLRRSVLFLYDSSESAAEWKKRDVEVWLYRLFGKQSTECQIVDQGQCTGLHQAFKGAWDATPRYSGQDVALSWGMPSSAVKWFGNWTLMLLCLIIGSLSFGVIYYNSVIKYK